MNSNYIGKITSDHIANGFFLIYGLLKYNGYY